MKILFSPSKTYAKKPKEETYYPSSPFFEAEAKQLFKILSKLSKTKLSTMMNVSESLFKEISLLYRGDYDSYPKFAAIQTYTGLAFRQLNLMEYKTEEWMYLRNHVRILSALYGVLKPEDQILPYRLDFTMSFPRPSLRQRWTSHLISYFKDEDWILNCASEEFSSLLDSLSPKIHTLTFYDEVKGSYKVNSAEAKKARGSFLHLCILHKVKTIEDLNLIHLPNYRKEMKLSNSSQSVFIRIQ